MWPGFIRGKEDTAALLALGSSFFSREVVIKSRGKGKKDNGKQRQLWFACVNTRGQLWLISSCSHYCHITPVSQELHWLPVRFRIKFKILLVIFKAIHGLAPTCFMNLVSVKKKSPYHLRSNEFLLVQPSFKLKKMSGDRAFSVAAPTLWKNLS